MFQHPLWFCIPSDRPFLGLVFLEVLAGGVVIGIASVRDANLEIMRF